MSFEQRVGEGLILRSVGNQEQHDRYVTFNAVYNNPFEGACGECLLSHHPHTTGDDYWFVEDEISGETVSTTCLLPWNSDFGGVDLRIAQLEMVLTHPGYRGRGLLRAQIKHFERTASDRGFDLCIISGIPFYYRQFGYSYTIDGRAFEALPRWLIPDRQLEAALPLRLRPALRADIALLVGFYERMTSALEFHIHRDAAYWQYLLEAAKHPIEMVENAVTGEVLGYVIIHRSAESIRIQENSLPDALTAHGLLQTLKSQCREQIIIVHPLENTLVQVARSLGSQFRREGQWLVRIQDWVGFLFRIAPLLMQRLAVAGWENLSDELTINFYREAYRVRFDAGKLVDVVPLGFVDSSLGADGGDLCIPQDAFVRLVTGYRNLDELLDAWPDIVIKQEARNLIDVLFPKMKAFLSAPYHYAGSLNDAQAG